MLPLFVPRRSSYCTSCEKRFTGGEPLLTLLKEGKDESFTREDLCESCAKGVDEALGYWRSTFPEKGKQRLSLTGIERFLMLFKEALKEGQEKAYPLALYLQRRGLLQKRKTLKRKNGDVALFEMAESGECFQVPIAHVELDKDALLTDQ